MAYLLKRISGLGKVKLIDACFIYTEEHSKRLKISIKVYRTFELGHNSYHKEEYKEDMEITYIVNGKHCLDCARLASNQTWSSVVQLRKKSKELFYMWSNEY